MSQRLLVTGATGTIGAELVRQLKRRGAGFAVMTSKPDRRIAGAETRIGDYTDPASLARAFAGVHTLFLLLPLLPDKLALARNAVAAARAAGVRHLVRLSGAGADSSTPVALSRLQGEIDDLVIASGIQYTLLRPNSFMQNHVTFNAAQIKAGAFHAPHGDGAISVVDARDIAEVAATVLTDPAAHAGRSYMPTGPEALTEAQQMAMISKALGRKVKYVDVPDQAAIDAMTRTKFPPVMIEWLASLNHVIKEGRAAAVSEDVKALTGHAPRSFEAFAMEHVAAWR